MSIPQNLLNKRIQIEDQIATVRYIGPVPPKGEWIGLEWDNVSRGKHDGVHDDVRYFTCSVPNSGSFIRYSSKINTGRSFDLDTLYWAGNTKIEVETLGFEKIRRKQRHLDRLLEVGLSLEQISSAGKPGEIEATYIIDLNLSKNLLSDWEIVDSICQQLKKLEVLRLNHNRFQALETIPKFTGFSNLKSLSLNYTRITWDQVVLFEPCLPNLENLQLGFNNIENLSSGNNQETNKKKVKGFLKLKILNLESNAINMWDEVIRFSELPNFEILFINNNFIDQISYQKGEEGEGFPKLRYLNISENKISDWNSINELNKFPSLQELRIKKNAFLEDEKPDEAHVSIIGRIKGLKMLNGSIISSGNRVDAERFYLRIFKELCEIHGTPVADEISVKAASGILKDRLLALTITHRPSLEGEPIKKVSKKLLGKNLKNLLQKLFGIPSSQQHLIGIINSQVGNVSQVEIKDDLRQLSYYDVSSGDEIIILTTA
ncbi:411_t:CDS:10 [Diversispora eburnea]|uniref:411_t:CDS:1 n=1 Tax=Diversispora eburnea TaxID=1213867 RepID=A0A9N8WIG3_9GLOM|nr:411_t:CDS:10 [Diversispora eburnea]